MKNIFLSIILASSFYFLASNSAFAACHPVYGGGSMCEQQGKITIDKTIKNQSGSFVDSLTPQESFSQNSGIEFQIVIKNTDTRLVKTITVKDILPESLIYVSSDGIYDGAAHTVIFATLELKKDESKTYIIKTKANEPKNGSCFANRVQVTQGRNINQDATEFCIQAVLSGQTSGIQTNGIPLTTKGGQPIYAPQQTAQAPATGPEMIPLLALIPTILGGIYLRRKTASIL